MWLALTYLIVVYAFGGCFSLEHPKGPQEGNERWCVWHSAFIDRLLTLHDVSLVTFLQGPLGRPFAKPTRLLVGRLPGMAQALYSRYDTSWKPTQVLGGRGSTGWKTASAKVYPANLSAAIAEQFVLFASSAQRSGHTDEPKWLPTAIDRLSMWDPYGDTHSAMRADFHRG